MNIKLKKLSIQDDIDVFEMLQDIDSMENHFTNPVYGMNFTEYKAWLVQQNDWSENRNLPDGYVGQTIFWLYVDEYPVGFGKIRHSISDRMRISGGNIGYAIGKSYRGKGYGTIFLSLLIEEAKKMHIDEFLFTIDKKNYASRKVVEKNNGVLISENSERWYFTLNGEK